MSVDVHLISTLSVQLPVSGRTISPHGDTKAPSRVIPLVGHLPSLGFFSVVNDVELALSFVLPLRFQTPLTSASVLQPLCQDLPGSFLPPGQPEQVPHEDIKAASPSVVVKRWTLESARPGFKPLLHCCVTLSKLRPFCASGFPSGEWRRPYIPYAVVTRTE